MFFINPYSIFTRALWILLITSNVFAETPELGVQFQMLQQEAERLAGGPRDVAQRVVFLHEIFLDSGNNHVFPEVALHGALWANQFFSRKNTLERLLIFKHKPPVLIQAPIVLRIQEFELELLKTNRKVFIDTYTNYYFSKKFGMQPRASEFVPAPLLELLNQTHLLRDQQDIDEDSLRSFRARLFESSLRNEQEKSVAPMIQSAAQHFCVPTDRLCPWIRALILKPVVRFKYFPTDQPPFFFFNFADSDERIHYALKSYELAEDAGWPTVEGTIPSYGISYPPRFISDPLGYAKDLRALLLQ